MKRRHKFEKGGLEIIKRATTWRMRHGATWLDGYLPCLVWSSYCQRCCGGQVPSYLQNYGLIGRGSEVGAINRVRPSLSARPTPWTLV